MSHQNCFSTTKTAAAIKMKIRYSMKLRKSVSRYFQPMKISISARANCWYLLKRLLVVDDTFISSCSNLSSLASYHATQRYHLAQIESSSFLTQCSPALINSLLNNYFMSSSLPTTKDVGNLMREKILHFNQNTHTPAVVFLLNNLKKPNTKKPRRTILLPKLKDQSFHYKSLHNSRVSSINNSIDSTILNDMSTINDENANIRIKDIASKSLLSPKSSEQLMFLQAVESEPKRFFRGSSKIRAQDQSLIKIEKSIRSMSVQPRMEEPKPKELPRQDNDEIQQYQFQKFADFDSIRNSTTNQGAWSLLDYFQEMQGPIMRVIRQKDPEKMIDLFSPALEICQEYNIMGLFSETVFYLGSFCLDCEQIDKAVFFFEQALIISEYTRQYPLKLKVLQQIAVCATKLKKYQAAIDLLKKSLVYAWVTDDFQKEILAYDMLGLNFFYSGDVKNASKFHEKYILSEVEPQNGYFRKTSEKFIKFYEHSLQYQGKDINRIFMLKLTLPIKNRFEQPINEVYPRCDQFRIIKYSNCDAAGIIDKIINGVEFTQYYLDYYTIGNRLRKIEILGKPKAGDKHERLPRRIIEIKLKYSDHKANYSFSHNINDNPNYKVPLDDMVQARVQRKFDIDLVWERVIRNRGWDPPGGEKQSQIYMKHLQDVRPSKHVWFQFLRRNREIINEILETLRQV